MKVKTLLQLALCSGALTSVGRHTLTQKYASLAPLSAHKTYTIFVLHYFALLSKFLNAIFHALNACVTILVNSETQMQRDTQQTGLDAERQSLYWSLNRSSTGKQSKQRKQEQTGHRQKSKNRDNKLSQKPWNKTLGEKCNAHMR